MTARERTYRWEDPQSAAAGFEDRTPLEWMSAIVSGAIPPPPFAATLGMEFELAEPGRVVFGLQVHEWMVNPTGVVHGGMAASLLDTVLSLAAATHLPAGRITTTLNLNVHYVRPLYPTRERVRAEGLLVHMGSTVATSQARLLDAESKLIAHASASLAIVDVTRFRGRP